MPTVEYTDGKLSSPQLASPSGTLPVSVGTGRGLLIGARPKWRLRG